MELIWNVESFCYQNLLFSSILSRLIPWRGRRFDKHWFWYEYCWDFQTIFSILKVFLALLSLLLMSLPVPPINPDDAAKIVDVSVVWRLCLLNWIAKGFDTFKYYSCFLLTYFKVYLISIVDESRRSLLYSGACGRSEPSRQRNPSLPILCKVSI